MSNLRYNISATANLTVYLTNFMNQNNISAYDMRNYLNNFIIQLDEAIQTDLLLEIQEKEEEIQHQHQEEDTLDPIEEN